MIFLFRWSNLQINIFKSTLNYLKLWLKHAKIYNINLRKVWLTKCRLWPAFICFTINETMCLLVLHSCQHHTWHRWRAKHNRAGIPAGLRQGCGGCWPEGWIWWFSWWAWWSWEPCFVCSTSLWSIPVSHRVRKWRILYLKQSSLCSIFVHTLKKFIIVKVKVFDNFISWFSKKFDIFFISYLQYFIKLYNLIMKNDIYQL